MLNRLKKEIEEAKNPEQAKILQRFFKTGKGEYGEGDIFLGIKYLYKEKLQRDIQFIFYGFTDSLNSKIHEERLIALIILTNKYQKVKDFVKKKTNI